MFADDEVRFVVGVDPHAECHAVVVVDGATRRTRSVITIPATRRGYQAALDHVSQNAPGARVWAVEGSGSYGAGLAMFLSERGQPLTRSSVQYLVRVAGEGAGLQGIHPHVLRHSCGYYLADKGTDLRTMQDYLGHRDPRHTVHYTRVAGRRFEGLWK